MTAAGRFGKRALERLGAWSMATALVLASLTATTAAASGVEKPAAVPGVASQTIVKTADLSKFQPGNIISDAAFFNSGTMTQAQIQSFLEAKVPSCRSGYTCLKDWHDTSRTTTADAMCKAYSGGIRERASAIIYKVAQACGINPQVLLVMLQKEQGLVLHTWPSEWRYTIAMGQGCPDTAACDTRYYGFFNQVYGAAWQMKRYANPPGTSAYFTWFAPGRTWNVRWHPNAACGSAPVYIQNQATANLYYYTPYQPNAAAIRAGYGEGDGCSAYGNRNFYQYFTDWFGSSQASPALVTVGYDIWITSAGRRYHVTQAEWPAYQKAFGAPTPVDAGYLGGYSDAGKASLFLRNERTGDVAYLEAGQTHRFASCTLVALWGGGPCATLTRLSGDHFTRLPQGAAMTAFARTSSTSAVHILDGSRIAPVFDQETATILNGGTNPYAAVMPASVLAGFTTAPVRFAPGRFITIQGSSRVHLPTADGRLLYLPEWALAADIGLTAAVYRTVPGTAVGGFDTSTALSRFVSCGGQAMFASAGQLRPVASGSVPGFSVAPLDSATCALLKVAKEAASPVFVTATGTPHVFHAIGGVYRHVNTPAKLAALAGATAIRVIGIAPEQFSTLPIGQPYGVPGELVKSPDSAMVYLLDGDRLVYLPSWGLATQMGLSPTIRVTPVFPAQPNAPALVERIVCRGTLYVARDGMLWPEPTGSQEGALALADSTCATLRFSA